jgi:hypothetical protein
MNNGNFDYEGAVRQRMADLIEDARYQSQPPRLDLGKPGTATNWRLAELAIDLFVNEITERDMLAWIANLDDEAELGRLVARELRHALEICVKQEDECGMSLAEREDLDARATAADIAFDRSKDEQRGLA